MPAAGSTTTLTWTGTIPAGSNATSDCTTLEGTAADAQTIDHHGITIEVPKAGYTGLATTFTFQISWTPSSGNENTNDEILTVVSKEGDDADSSETREIGSSDGSDTKETVAATNLPPGAYDVLACGFANALPQTYTGTLTMKSATVSDTGSLPSANPQGLAFSAAVAADPQRDEGEPLIVSDQAGLLYECGPTGFSQAADYAQVSTDGGDQFHLLGTPPRGQQGLGGGGDCVMATGEAKNSQGHYQYAYAGLGGLTGFTTSTSADDGHTLENSGPNGNGLPGATSNGALADRQWMTFTDATTVLLSYNQQEPRNIVVQKSTDGGLTYSPISTVAAPNPDFPGPMHYIASLHTVVMPWTKGEQVNLAISRDDGSTWTDCVVGPSPGGSAGFATSDIDSAGNVYVAWADKVDYHTWLSVLPAAKVTACDEPESKVAASADGQPTVQPGFTKPLQMDRGDVRTTVFPWVAAGGAPGRVAVTFYGTSRDGDPNTGQFKAAWNVYVSQTLDAFDASPAVAQVVATTHPFHYDSICLNGLGCDVSGGDRSLLDFFAMTYDKVDGRLSVTFARTNKKPDDTAGYIATPMVTTQIAGPSNGGGTVSVKDREPLRNSTVDPKGDALTPYSELGATPSPANVPAGDFTAASVGPDPKTGGFTVTLHLADLSSSALSAAAGTGSLVWIWRFTNGWQDAAAVASWSPASGFAYGYDGYTTDSGTCGGEGGQKCEIYPGNTPIKGSVDQKAGTITLVVPKSVLHPLAGVDQYGRPKQAAATSGSRFYDGTAFSFENPSPDPSTQSWMTQLDNTPAFDFLLGGALPGGSGPGSTGGTGGTGATKTGTSGARAGSGPTVSSRAIGSYRLVIDQFGVSPGVVTGREPVRLSVHVSDTHGDNVSRALVYVLGIPAHRVEPVREGATGASGWATFRLRPGKALPRRHGRLVLFLRARVPGQPLLGGASTRRLVSLHVDRRRAHAGARYSRQRRVLEGAVGYRLLISHVSFRPKRITSRRAPLRVRVHVVGSDGKPATGALVQVIGVPFARVTTPSEARTGRSGWATLVLRARRALPIRRGGLLTLFVRARLAGQPVIAGASTRRLVAIRVR